MVIRFHNTFTRKLEEFNPQVPGEVRMYNCGPTVYSSPHIGNFRSFLFADLLRRFLDWKGFQVHQVMNLTDVGHLTLDDIDAGDDKMEEAAAREKVTVWDLAERYIDEFHAACEQLSIRPAHEYPRATDHIDEMKEMIATLLEKKIAYVAGEGNVYFDVSRFERYGKLSGNTMEDLLAGARIEVNDEKRDPRDFALWKVDSKHQMQWDAPWGRGFPGWHIECSAMSRKYLGDTLDIHTGGEDNVFPHHECEIAQSECANGQPFVRHWMHARHLLVDGRKMSKSQGNFFTIADLRGEGFSGDGIRLSLSRVHYREPLNFTRTGLEEAERKIQRYADLQSRLREKAAVGVPPEAVRSTCAALRERFDAALCDDLNVSVALAAVDELVAEANRQDPEGPAAQHFLDELTGFWSVLGLLQSSTDTRIDPEIQRLVEERGKARAEKNYARADEIRDLLHQKGVEVKDTKDGPKIIALGSAGNEG